MCSISGYIRFDEAPSRAPVNRLRQIIKRAADRGRDSAGVAGVLPDGDVNTSKAVGHPDQLAAKPLHGFDEAQIVINNNRAEPTTEYVAEKDEVRDVQPFTDNTERYFVSHNGMIANDEELKEKYGFSPETSVDTGVVPYLLAEKWDGTLEDLRELLMEEIVGAFSFAIIDAEQPSNLFLACNYKPLSVQYDEDLDAVFFSTLDEYMERSSPNAIFDTRLKGYQLEPYTVAKVSEEGVETMNLGEGSDTEALVVASGGLDSTTVAKVMQDRGYAVTLLHFMYSHRAESSEEESIEEVADRLGVELLKVEMDVFKEVIGNSPLTNTGADIADGEEGAEFAHEWVPSRNFIMLAVASGIAEGNGFDVLASGVNLEESGAYPDNEMEFVERVGDVLPYATAEDSHVDIEMPVGNLMKHEIVSLGLEHDAPLDITWSCYDDGDLHCGECGPCFMRKTAFEINGVEEVIDYANEQRLPSDELIADMSYRELQQVAKRHDIKANQSGDDIKADIAALREAGVN